MSSSTPASLVPVRQISLRTCLHDLEQVPIDPPSTSSTPASTTLVNGTGAIQTEAEGLPKKTVQKENPFVVEKEEVIFKRYLKVWNRTVRYPDGRVIDWDVVGHMTAVPAFCTIFPFNTKTKTTTLLVEYAQGTNDLKYTFASGGFDERKHKDIFETARSELSEEAHLTGGTWHRLIPDSTPGIAEVKWCRNRFVPFLVLDPELDTDPKQRDAEELIDVHHTVTLEQLKSYILRGIVALPSVQTAVMAMEWLKQNGYINEGLL
ncbi:hypothetical protein HK102_007225 [Quaeritorhiza haematococci]|nr:hypothetical protein HK102_007225 [Quaeritorhiza haematococci]